MELSTLVLKQAKRQGYEDILVGQSCKKWKSNDKVPWCIVGFDSACADREELTMGADGTAGSGVRLWKSSLPCQHDQFAHSTAAGMELCSGLRVMWFCLDGLRYLLLLPMMYMTYQFLMRRCADYVVRDSFVIEDDDPGDWSSSGSASAAGSSESETQSEKPETAKQAKEKLKADHSKSKEKLRKQESGAWDIDDD